MSDYINKNKVWGIMDEKKNILIKRENGKDWITKSDIENFRRDEELEEEQRKIKLRKIFLWTTCAILAFFVLNFIAGQVYTPNLKPTKITLDTSKALVGRPVNFDSGIRNTGGTDTRNFNIKWFVDGQDINAYGSHAGMPAGKTIMEGNSQFKWIFDKAGWHKVTFTVDVDNHVRESNEEDNSKTVGILVK